MKSKETIRTFEAGDVITPKEVPVQAEYENACIHNPKARLRIKSIREDGMLVLTCMDGHRISSVYAQADFNLAQDTTTKES